MYRKLGSIFLTVLLGGLVQRGINPPASTLAGVGAPSNPCSAPGIIYIQTDAVASQKIWVCPAIAGTWEQQGAVDTVPSGSTMFIVSGTCPTNWTEVAGLDGKTLWGTLNAHGDIGGTGGADTVTPSGANSNTSGGTPTGTNSAPTISGTTASESSHTHAKGTFTALTSGLSEQWCNGADCNYGVIHFLQAIKGGGLTFTTTHTTNAGATNIVEDDLTVLQQTITSSGFNDVSLAGTSASGSAHSHGVGSLVAATPTFTGNALSTHTHTFTGASLDNRSAFMKVIYCKRN